MESKPKMEYRFLGNTGLKVSVIGYGNWLNSNKPDQQKTTTDAVKRALDFGINFFDTAEAYGHGEAERQLGIAFKDIGVHREDIVVTTKIFWALPGGKPNRIGLSAKRIHQGLAASLKRLQLDYVDVVYAHRPDSESPIEETCRAFDSVIRSGQAFYWGTSEWSAAEIVEAILTCEKLNLHQPVTEQPQYNMLARQRFEAEYGIIFDQYRYGSTIWSPLCGGVLTGKYKDGVIPEGTRQAWIEFPHVKARFEKLFGVDKDKTIKMFVELEKIAAELGTSLTTLSMAWVIQNKDVSVAITGVSRPEQLDDSVKAVELYGKITKDIEAQIEKALDNTPDFGFDFKNFSVGKPRGRN